MLLIVIDSLRSTAAEHALVLLAEKPFHLTQGTTTNVPLRYGKASAYEGGVRVPCIVRWPGKVPASAVCREPAITMDLFATIGAIVGAELPSNRIIDGKDLTVVPANRRHAGILFQDPLLFPHLSVGGNIA